MFERVLKTINRLADSNQPTPENKPAPSREQLLQWATGCMWEGLPDSFHLAWLEYQKGPDRKSLISYQCILDEGAIVTNFQPADDLYPVQCIEQLDSYLEPQKRAWRSCRLEFNPQTVSLTYDY